MTTVQQTRALIHDAAEALDRLDSLLADNGAGHLPTVAVARCIVTLDGFLSEMGRHLEVLGATHHVHEAK